MSNRSHHTDLFLDKLRDAEFCGSKRLSALHFATKLGLLQYKLADVQRDGDLASEATIKAEIHRIIEVADGEYYHDMLMQHALAKYYLLTEMNSAKADQALSRASRPGTYIHSELFPSDIQKMQGIRRPEVSLEAERRLFNALLLCVRNGVREGLPAILQALEYALLKDLPSIDLSLLRCLSRFGLRLSENDVNAVVRLLGRFPALAPASIDRIRRTLAEGVH